MSLTAHVSPLIFVWVIMCVSCQGYYTHDEVPKTPSLDKATIDSPDNVSSNREDFMDLVTPIPRQPKPVGKDDIVIPITVKRWMVKNKQGLYPRKKKPHRRNSISPSLANLSPSTTSSLSQPAYVPSGTSFTPVTSSSNQESETITGMIAKWNPKINLTWPPSITMSGTSEYPEYQTAAGHHEEHYEHPHFQYKSHAPAVQYIPIPYCHHDHHVVSKKKEISLIWPLIILGIIFLPLLVGGLLLPLAFLFISNIIQLLTLLQRIPLTTAATPTAGKRKKRSTNDRFFSNHPELMKQIDFLTDQVDCGLQKFIKYLYDE